MREERVDMTMPKNTNRRADDVARREVQQLSALLEGGVAAIDDKKQDELFKAIQKLYDGKNLWGITDLSEAKIEALTKLDAWNRWIKKYSGKQNHMLAAVAITFMQLRVSVNRRGRGEFFETFKAGNPLQRSEQNTWYEKYMKPRSDMR